MPSPGRPASEARKADAYAGEPVFLPFPVLDHRAAATPDRRRLLVIVGIVLVVWGWVDVRLRGTVDPANAEIHKTDFTVYTEAGAAFFDGRDPYQVTNPRGWGYLYLPLFAMLVAPLHVFSPRTQVLIWFYLSVLMLWGCYRECQRLRGLLFNDRLDGGRARQWSSMSIPGWIGWAAVLAIMLPAFNCMQRGQIGMLKLYLLLLGFRLVLSSGTLLRSFAAGAVLSLPIVLKITPAVPVGCLLLQQFASAWWSGERRVKSLRGASCSLGVVCGLLFCIFPLPSAMVGSEANLHHLNSWWNLVGSKADDVGFDRFAGNSYSVRNQSLSNAVHRFGNWAGYQFAGGGYDDLGEEFDRQAARLAMDTEFVAQVLLPVRAALGGLLLVLVIVAARRQDRLLEAAVFGLACVATLIVSPIARGHYYVLLLPASLFLPWWLDCAGRHRLARWMAWIPAALTIAHYTAMDFTGRVGLLGLGITAWYIAATSLIIAFSRQATENERSTEAEPHADWTGTVAPLRKAA